MLRVSIQDTANHELSHAKRIKIRKMIKMVFVFEFEFEFEFEYEFEFKNKRFKENFPSNQNKAPPMAKKNKCTGHKK